MSFNLSQQEAQSTSSLQEIRATRLAKVEELKKLGLIPSKTILCRAPSPQGRSCKRELAFFRS